MRLIFYTHTITGHPEALDLDTGLVYTRSVNLKGEPTVGVNSVLSGSANGRMPGDAWEELIAQNQRAEGERAALIDGLKNLYSLLERALVLENNK